MKRVRIFLLVLFMGLLCSIPSIVFGNEKGTYDNFKYEIDTEINEVIITGYRGVDSSIIEIVIPETIEEYPVTKIKELAFSKCEKLTTLKIPSNLKIIEKNAFRNCVRLSNITLLEGLEIIGEGAFYGCASLEHITLPNSLKEIRWEAFSNCTSLVDITLPEGLTELGSSIFWQCISLTHIALPKSLRVIGGATFYGCTSLVDITLPEGLIEIANNAFSYTNLTNITLPEGLVQIGEKAFEGCWNLKELTIPANVTINNKTFIGLELGKVIFKEGREKIPKDIFSGNLTLTEVILPEGLTGIEEHAFADCRSLNNITLPESLIEIGNEAFFYCESLTNIILPEGLMQIGEGAFYGCNLKEITIPANITNATFAFEYSEIEKVVFANGVKKVSDYMFYYCESLTDIVLPESINEIGEHAFEGCTNLISIALPVSITQIGEKAFGNCTNLTNITLPENLIQMGDYVFEYCTNLKEVTIPAYAIINDKTFRESELEKVIFAEGRRNIPSNLFNGHNTLTEVVLADSIETIGSFAFTTVKELIIPANVTFSSSYAFGSELEKVIFKEGRKKIPRGMFYGNIALAEVILPEGLIEIEDEAFCDTNLTNITLPKSVTKIGNEAFSYTNLTSITLPESLTEMGCKVFNYCESLKEVIIPTNIIKATYSFENSAVEKVIFTEGVKKIPNNMFSCCERLTDIVLAESITQIGEYAFEYCTNLANITLPAGITQIESFAFTGCTKLANITLPEGLTQIGERTFWGCTSLFSIELPEGLKELDNGAFSSCKSLTNIVLPKSITQIGEYAFEYCTNLVNITLSDGIIQIKKGTFSGCTNLSNITLPEGLKKIESNAFSSCTSLTNITIPASIENIEDYAFNNCDESLVLNVMGGTCAENFAKLNNLKYNLYGILMNSCYIEHNGNSYETAEVFYETYIGKSIEPDIRVIHDDIVLEEGKDYDISYTDNMNVGRAEITINGIGKCVGAITQCFEIIPKSITMEEVIIDLTDKIYTREEITTNLELKYGDISLVKDIDYKVTYTDNINVGIAKITITGKGNYTGVVTKSFNIVPKNLSEIEVRMDQTDVEYTKYEIIKNVTVEDEEATLEEGRDYQLEYQNNINIGISTVTITGKGNYTGVVTKSFNIVPKNLSEIEVRMDQTDVEYTKYEIIKNVTLKDEEATLEEGRDYQLEYQNNINVGSSTVSIIGKGNYTGVIAKTFEIVPKNLSKITIRNSEIEYTGQEITNNITLKDGETELEDGKDYQIKYENNKNVGNATAIITGKGNYTGTITKAFSILPKNLSKTTITLTNEEYTGQEITSNAILKNGDIVLEEGKDYEVKYQNNLNVGMATVTITGKGNYTGTITKTFKIVPKSLSKIEVAIDSIDTEYTWQEIVNKEILLKHGEKVLEKYKDYDIVYQNFINNGLAIVTITGKENYTGTITKTFRIVPKDLSEIEIIMNQANVAYTGKEITKNITLKDGEAVLEEGRDYQIEYQNNTNVGTANVIIVGKENYAGTITKTFEITLKKMSEITAIIDDYYKEYTNEPITTEILLKNGNIVLEEGKDYEIEYHNNINVGNAIIIITGKGNYEGNIIKTFEIVELTVRIDDADVIYTGNPICPEVMIFGPNGLLSYREDYEVEYQNNIEVGTATVIVKGKKMKMKEVRKTFEIIPIPISSAKLIVNNYNYIYTGKPIMPEVIMIYKNEVLEKGKDYEVKYYDNINSGPQNAILEVVGKGKFGGRTSNVEFYISSRNLSEVREKVDVEDKVYTGKPIVTDINLTYENMLLKEGKDYEVEYQNNIEVGIATVKITGKENYKGTIIKKFKIKESNIQRPTIVDNPFIDVTKSSYYYSAVEYCYKNGIIKGTTETTFSPNKKLTRGQLATILWRMENMPNSADGKKFPDVKTSDYYYNAVKWASANKIVNGYSTGKFGPNDNVTREQLATILMNYAKYKKKDTTARIDITTFKDGKYVANYSVNALSWAVASKIMSGKENGTKLDPKGNASRAEAATMLYNYCNYIGG